MFRRLLVLTFALAVAVSACTDSEPVESVVFGEGELPSTFPADFPVPSVGSIGATLVDNANGRTEVSILVPQEVEAAAQFFVVNLVNQGYVVDSSSGDTDQWEIDFRRDDLTGSIQVRVVAPGTSQAVVTLTE